MRFKIDWASLVLESKFTVFALFHFVFKGNFPSTSPRGAYIRKGDLRESLFALPVWGAYMWRSYFRNFTVFFFVFKYRINFAGNCSIVSQRKELQYLRCYCAKMVTFLLSYISYFKSVCNAVNVVVQSYPWSKFLFSLHQTFNIQYHTQKQRNRVKFEPSTG